ncbi:hypothetical protein BOX15_Mlig002900g2 [Macrostomum lignano]|uniref:F-box domain-containing protein n=1 Tax=Macrostomum lignano TaxID=282301 RepID=A0A267ECU9_9PLAT|nr:hypothetical protein BOX15_Mlig002900g2 [Macrostomum lignano]
MQLNESNASADPPSLSSPDKCSGVTAPVQLVAAASSKPNLSGYNPPARQISVKILSKSTSQSAIDNSEQNSGPSKLTPPSPGATALESGRKPTSEQPPKPVLKVTCQPMPTPIIQPKVQSAPVFKVTSQPISVTAPQQQPAKPIFKVARQSLSIVNPQQQPQRQQSTTPIIKLNCQPMTVSQMRQPQPQQQATQSGNPSKLPDAPPSFGKPSQKRQSRKQQVLGQQQSQPQAGQRSSKTDSAIMWKRLSASEMLKKQQQLKQQNSNELFPPGPCSHICSAAAPAHSVSDSGATSKPCGPQCFPSGALPSTECKHCYLLFHRRCIKSNDAKRQGLCNSCLQKQPSPANSNSTRKRSHNSSENEKHGGTETKEDTESCSSASASADFEQTPASKKAKKSLNTPPASSSTRPQVSGDLTEPAQTAAKKPLQISLVRAVSKVDGKKPADAASPELAGYGNKANYFSQVGLTSGPKLSISSDSGKQKEQQQIYKIQLNSNGSKRTSTNKTSIPEANLEQESDADKEADSATPLTQKRKPEVQMAPAEAPRQKPSTRTVKVQARCRFRLKMSEKFAKYYSPLGNISTLSFRILERIFDQLELADLLTCRLVCSEWRRLVDCHRTFSSLCLSSDCCSTINWRLLGDQLARCQTRSLDLRKLSGAVSATAARAVHESLCSRSLTSVRLATLESATLARLLSLGRQLDLSWLEFTINCLVDSAEPAAPAGFDLVQCLQSLSRLQRLSVGATAGLRLDCLVASGAEFPLTRLALRNLAANSRPPPVLLPALARITVSGQSACLAAWVAAAAGRACRQLKLLGPRSTADLADLGLAWRETLASLTALESLTIGVDRLPLPAQLVDWLPAGLPSLILAIAAAAGCDQQQQRMHQQLTARLLAQQLSNRGTKLTVIGR